MDGIDVAISVVWTRNMCVIGCVGNDYSAVTTSVRAIATVDTVNDAGKLVSTALCTVVFDFVLWIL